MARAVVSIMSLGLVLGIGASCVRVQTEPIRIEPIYIEITVNHRVQEELDSVFAEIDQASKTTEYAPLDDSSNEPLK